MNRLSLSLPVKYSLEEHKVNNTICNTNNERDCLFTEQFNNTKCNVNTEYNKIHDQLTVYNNDKFNNA
jgi:hypothetical protein